jgi:DNA-directed RNA polymerase specialized sigma24 family protein
MTVEQLAEAHKIGYAELDRLGYVLSEEDREDVVAESVERAVRKFDPEKGGFSTLLTTCVRSAANNQLKANSRHQRRVVALGESMVHSARKL